MTVGIASNKWYKFDFHSHTPASLDYREPIAPTAVEWLKAAMANELDCVAVTDHNTGGWIDILKATYQEIISEDWFRPLVIFPGCELTISLGASRIHFLAIFDPSTSTEGITRFLGSCDLQGTFGDPENCFTTQSIEIITKKIKDANGIAIPAHIDAEKGLLHNITTTNPDLKKHIALFESAQFVNPNYLNESTIHIELKKDIEHLAIIRGSDAHNLNDLGKVYSWIKMGSPIIDGLKFALKDHDFCVLNQEANPNTVPRSYIKNISISSMRHCGMNPTNVPTFQLHPLFNAIIGGRGTGKSTFIESLRLVLGRTDDIEELEAVNKDITNFIDGVTTERTSINLTLEKNLVEYRSEWKKNSELKFERQEDDFSWTIDAGDIKERFPVNIYSQKQINALASNPTGLLEIIDRSNTVNKKEWDERFDAIKQEYLQLSLEENDLNKYISQDDSKRARLRELVNDITNFESGGHNSIITINQNIININRAMECAGDVSIISTALNELCLKDKPMLNLDSFYEEGADPHRAELEKIQKIFNDEIDDIFINLELLKERLNKAKEQREKSIQNSDWLVYKDSLEKHYEEVVSDYKERGIEFNTTEYELWIQERYRIEKQLEITVKKKSRVDDICEKKEELLTNLFALRTDLVNKRQAFIDSILDDNQYVKMTINPYSDTSRIERFFRDTIGSENFSTSIYEDENKNTLLYGIIHSKLTEESKIAEKNKLMGAISSLIQGVIPSKYKINRRFMTYLQEKSETSPEFIAKLNVWMPDDFLEVKYSQRGDGTSFSNINKGSAGQKAAAILAFLLSHGEEPIIVDQPEDDLDNALVYSLIVNQIRLNKKRRQIIIVTHNPNIVVNGDAELVNVMEFRGGQVQIKTSGSLIEQSIRDEVCDIMEGGKEAFNKRYQRIHTPN